MSLPQMRRLTLDVATRVTRMGRAEPQTRRVSRETSYRSLRRNRYVKIGMVETSLEAVVCAEPHCCWRFRASALTESTLPLELVSPSRTRRADFPHRAPQMTFTKSTALDRWMQVAREG